jgi:hypothetical protein
MADNVSISKGWGVPVSSKDVGAGVEVQRIAASYDTGLAIKNFASAEALILLRRLVKLTEARDIADNVDRQRMSVDGWGGASIPMNLGTATTTYITSDPTIDPNDPANTRQPISTPRIVLATSSTFGNTTVAGMDREQYINIARETSADSFRPNLTFR